MTVQSKITPLSCRISQIAARHGRCGTLAQVSSFLLQCRKRSSASDARDRKRALDRDFIVSILESSATRRDAKGYLRKYAPQPESASASAHHHHPTISSAADRAKTTASGRRRFLESSYRLDNLPSHIAIVKICAISSIHGSVCESVAKTLSQLRTLGLLSVVVIEDGLNATRAGLLDQAYRVSGLIDKFGNPKSRVLETVFEKFPGGGIDIQKSWPIAALLAKEVILVIVTISVCPEISRLDIVDADDAIVALTKHFSHDPSRLMSNAPAATTVTTTTPAPATAATTTTAATHTYSETSTSSIQPEMMVERIIILDPGGGVPMANGPGSCHRFINLHQEYDRIMSELAMPDKELDWTFTRSTHSIPAPRPTHAKNLKLSRDTLELLPSSSSVLITTPLAAAHTLASGHEGSTQSRDGGLVKTRMRQNPLIHNLLTDKPVYSSSLPLERIYGGAGQETGAERPSIPTLVKRGMPLTIYPDPRHTRWTSPWLGQSRPRLTDSCVDLERLVYLIEDSFGRELDVSHYLNRVNENLAGVIVVGKYEGAAILTWERPEGVAPHPGSSSAERVVPYLDKFAVLKSQQGSGGVADIIFNAMVRDCFPDGVCWRSRRDNPVNKWYFERSVGSLKLRSSNWTMFWTRPDAVSSDNATLYDYESVCRSVQPSWMDKKAVAD